MKNKDMNGSETQYLEGEIVRFRPLERADMTGNWFGWLNDIEVTRYLAIGDSPNSMEAMENFYSRIRRSGTDVVFAIIHKPTGAHIGNCGLHDISSQHKKARLAVLIGETRFRGLGIGSEATKMLVVFGFNVLELNRIFLNVDIENIRAIKIYEKLGFRREGVLRQDIFKQGAYRDLAVMGLLRSEFLA